MQKCWRQHRDNKSRPDTVILKWTWLEPASFTLLRPRRIRIHWPVVQRRTRAKHLHPQENGWICSDVLCLSVTTQNQTDNAKPNRQRKTKQTTQNHSSPKTILSFRQGREESQKNLFLCFRLARCFTELTSCYTGFFRLVDIGQSTIYKYDGEIQFVFSWN